METLRIGDLVLEPLTAAHAESMFPLLREPELYRHLDHGPPPSVEHLRRVYERLERRESSDGDETWLNWVIHLEQREPIGFVQATITSQRSAWIAYLLGRAHWGRGHARAATGVMIAHLRARYGATELLATVEAANDRSIALLRSLGFRDATVEEATRHELSRTELLFVNRGEPG